METMTPEEKTALARRLLAMPEGPYLLGAEIENAAKDKRKRHGNQLDAGPDRFDAGSRWILRWWGRDSERSLAREPRPRQLRLQPVHVLRGSRSLRRRRRRADRLCPVRR